MVFFVLGLCNEEFAFHLDKSRASKDHLPDPPPHNRSMMVKGIGGDEGDTVGTHDAESRHFHD